MALKITQTTPSSELNLNIPSKNIENIEKLLHDSTYTELIEFSATFNTRLRIERKMRFPFLDAQTGVAQKHSNLFMKKAQRIPGLREGQIYTYPSFRWRKAKRQYLNNPNSYPWNYRPFGRFTRDNEIGDIPVGVGGDFLPPSEENAFRPSFADELSKDSHKDDGSKGSGWYYDDMDMHEMDNFDDPEEDSDDDFMEPRSGRKKRAGGSGRTGPSSSRRRTNNDVDTRRGGRGRGRKKPNPSAMDTNSNSSDKFNEYSRRRSNLPPQVQTIHNPNPTSLDEAIPEHRIPTTERGKTHFSEEERSTINTTASTSGGAIMSSSSGFRNEKPRATPSPYCDFCLGDTKENKKTGVPEELVSCSDCGRSGHPTCLQFTENMIISVKKYRWQCIECKCCSLCGTSENDETLLFCDSCDAGKG